MNNEKTDYDCAVIGGGAAGLALSILLAKDNKSVVLFEKETYPFNKVCGEYISNESVKFLNNLGLDLSNYDLPKMNSLFLSSVSGIAIERNLSIGGVGFSRYKLDQNLYELALACGVDVKIKTRVRQIDFENDCFQIFFENKSVSARITCGAYGKNSNIDAQLNRTIRAKNKDLFIAVKHHIKTLYDRNRVELHNFDGGYCGLSSIEDGKVNMSYITKAENLKKCEGKIAEMEKRILSKNPFLKKHFDHAVFELEKPLVISHLHFGIKNIVDSHILMIGDAAGNIAPLSGNGISMSLRSAAIAYRKIDKFLNKQISREKMETEFADEYKKTFSTRITAAKLVHYTFGKPLLNNLSFYFLQAFPFFIDLSQKRIHGTEF